MTWIENKELLRSRYEQEDKRREYTIQQSRILAKEAKRAVYAIHEGSIQKAQDILTQLEETHKKIRSEGLESEPSYQHAYEEEIEARALLAFIQETPFTYTQASTETLLCGMCDASGEIVRIAIRAGIQQDKQTITRSRKAIEELHAYLLEYSLRNGHLRKKADMVRHNLQKVETIEYEYCLRRT